jgi:hypothetical protein
MACSYTSRFGLESREIRVGIASACLKSKCCEDADSFGRKVEPSPAFEPDTGVGGGKKELLDELPEPPTGGDPNPKGKLLDESPDSDEAKDDKPPKEVGAGEGPDTVTFDTALLLFEF